MARASTDPDIDRLFQLPPNEFTRERNALAKQKGGEPGRHIKELTRPSLSAWAVNQLYWRDRDTYDALVAASERLRTAHRAVLAGRKADLVGADAAHREAVKGALTSTLRLAKSAGQNVSSGAHNEIARTLESLSPDDTHGRLTKPLLPEGFEALQGMPIHARPAEPRKTDSEAGKPHKPAAAPAQKDTQRALTAARARERRDEASVVHAQKQLAAAERQTAVARAAWDRAQANEARLRETLQQAQDALDKSAADRRALEGKLLG